MSSAKVLFLHGFMGNPKEGLFLKEFGRLWAPDLLELSLNVENNLQTFYKAIEDYQPSLIYGYSLGGRLALDYLSHHPQFLGKMIIESASLPLTDTDTKENRGIIDQKRAEEIREDFPSFLEKWYQAPLWGERTVLELDDLKNEKKQRFSSRESLEALSKFLLFFSPAHFPKENTSFEQSLLYLYGEQDLKYKSLAQSYESSHPHWSFYEVPKAGHNIHTFKENEVLKQLRVFLSP